MNRTFRPAKPAKLHPILIAALLALAPGVLPAQDSHTVQPDPPPPSFLQNCALCHGADADGSDRAPALAHSGELHAMSEADIASIIRNGRGRMPAFPLPAPEITLLARYIKLLNASPLAAPDSASVSAGQALFFGQALCSTCHMVRGQGSDRGPDLSTIGGSLRPAGLEAALLHPSDRVTPGYTRVTAVLNNGSRLNGFARARGSHDIVLQTSDGALHPLLDTEYRAILADPAPAILPFHASPVQQRNLLAFLASLRTVPVGPVPSPQTPPNASQIAAIEHPQAGDWPTYNGNLSGNRDSPLRALNRTNAARLQLAWTYTIPFFGLETTPLAVHGILYVTGNNQVYALSGKSGRQIWSYQRPKSSSSTISGDAALGVNRGVAVLGDRVFYMTDDAHLLALDRLTGALLWEVRVPEGEGHFGATAAPLVLGNLVITGVSGGDNGIRGFIAAFHADTGALAWRFWTIPTPTDTGPIADTWHGSALALGGGATWTTGSADVPTGTLYWPVGNPHPDTDGDQRLGSNLYTDSDLALDGATGTLRWFFQFTPHDLHDWDANEPVVLIDTRWRGQNRKLLLHANRNGFLYVLDRTTGKPLLASPMVDKLTWAGSIDPLTFKPNLLPANETHDQPTLTCPAVRGATNWYSTAWNPGTRLFYVMTVEDCGFYRKAPDGGYGRYSNPADPARKILRAFNIESGKVVWQIEIPGPVQSNYAGVLSTAGGLVFFGESSGAFAAVDASTGRYLWHFETNHPIKASPMTYAIDGRQYVAIASGPNILAFALSPQGREGQPARKASR